MRPPEDIFTTEVSPGEEEGWLISYLDVLTLILTLLVLLLSFASWDQPEAGTRSPGLTVPLPMLDSGHLLLPEHSGLQPRHRKVEDTLGSLGLEGVEASLSQEGMTLRIAERLLFDSGSDQLKAGGQVVINRLLALLEEFDGEISIEGHTDDLPIQTSRFPSNWELSTSRAIAVLRFMESQGLPAERMRAVGYADTRPLAENDNDEGRAINRRVELVLRDYAAPD